MINIPQQLPLQERYCDHETVFNNQSSDIAQMTELYLQTINGNQKFQKCIQKRGVSSMQIQQKLMESLTPTQLKRYVYSPLKEGDTFSCVLRRDPKFFSDQFEVLGKHEKPIMFVNNKISCFGRTYRFGLQKNMTDSPQDPNYLGLLVSNILNTVYNLHGNGVQPDKAIENSKWKSHMAYISYDYHVIDSGPRRCSVIIPNFYQENEINFKSLDQQILAKVPCQMTHKYRNKKPLWNQSLQSYSLNFDNKVKLKSVKNFILVDDNGPNEDNPNGKAKILFGKIGNNVYYLQFSSPFSLFQAVGTAVSQFSFKIN